MGARVLATAEDWEIVDDEGFIFKRRKRKSAAPQEAEQQKEAGDEAEAEDVGEQLVETEEQTRMERLEARKAALLQRKQIYAAELRRWEELFRKLEEQAASVKPPPSPELSLVEEDSSQSPAVNPVADAHYEPYEELLRQVEELEWWIRKRTSSCEQAGDVCLWLEEELRNDALDLPSPHQIFP